MYDIFSLEKVLAHLYVLDREIAHGTRRVLDVLLDVPPPQPRKASSILHRG